MLPRKSSVVARPAFIARLRHISVHRPCPRVPSKRPRHLPSQISSLHQMTKSKTLLGGDHGSGVCHRTSGGKIHAPFCGSVASLFKTNHVIGLLSDDGREVLIHFGIDTVKLDGEGFRNFVSMGDRVQKGQLLIEVDLNFVKERVPSTITPIIFTNAGGKKVVLQKTGMRELLEERIFTLV